MLVRSWLGLVFVLYTKEDFLVLGLVNILRKLKIIIGSNFAKFSISKRKRGKKEKKNKKKTTLVPCGSLGLYSLNQIQTRPKTAKTSQHWFG
jgi:hypothetical protein